MSRLNRLLWTGLVLGVAACGDDVTVPPQAINVAVTPDGASIIVGQTLQMAAAVTGGPAGTATIAWSTSNAATATVSATGLVTGIAAGSVGITATATIGTSTGAGSATVNVQPATPPLPPTLSISSITNTIAGTGEVPVNIGAVAGQINVTVLLERNGNPISRVELVMKTPTGTDSVVALQTFTGAPPVQASPELVPEAIILSINTAAFSATTGAVSFTNGPNTLTARAFVVGGTSGPAAQNGVQFTLANLSGFQVQLANSGASATDGTGLIWTEGDVTMTVLPVIYTAGATVTTVVIDPDLDCDATTPGNQDGALNEKTGTTGTWAKATAPGAGSGSYQTASTGCTPGVEGSVLSNGQPGPTQSLGSVPLLRHDNLVPAGGTLVLTEQAAAVDCCSGNWFGTLYSFAAGHAASGGGVAPTDAGVGIGTTTYHFGPTSLSLTALVATAPVATGADVAETQTVTANNLAAKVCDKLNNCVNVALSSNGLSNTLTTAGADKVPPTYAYDNATSVADQAIFNAFTGVGGPHTFAAVGTDNLSSFGLNANAARIFGNFLTTSAAQCFTPYSGAFASGNCPFALQPSSTNTFSPVSPFARYLTDERSIRDQAGNKPAAPITRSILADDILPTVSNVAIPPSLVGGAPATFTAAAADGLDLGTAAFSLEYAVTPFTGSAALAFSTAETISDFGAPLVATHNASATVSFVRSLEAAAPAPAGATLPASHARFLITDVAGNFAVQSNLFAVGTVPAGTSATALNVASFQVATPAAAQNVCNAAGGCGTTPATPATRTVTITATGPVGSFANPFATVYVYFTDASGAHRLFATSSAAVSSAVGLVLTWTWTVTFDATGLAAQAGVPIFAVGVDAGGDGLYSAANVNISIVDPI